MLVTPFARLVLENVHVGVLLDLPPFGGGGLSWMIGAVFEHRELDCGSRSLFIAVDTGAAGVIFAHSFFYTK